MEEGRAHEEVALAAAPWGRRLARPVFYAAVALALLAFAVIVSGPEVSSALRRARLDREAKERVPILEARRRLSEGGWFASRSERRVREDAEFATLRALSDVAHEATRAGAEPIENHDRRTLIKGDHIIGVKTRFPVAWAAPKRSWLTEPTPAASS
jgi:hypothetical protein